MKNKKNIIILSAIVIFFVVVGAALYSLFAAPTRVALLNFKPFQATPIIKSNSDKFIRYYTISTEEMSNLGKYDFVLGNGMGLKITTEQREQLQKIAKKGTPIYIHVPTNPQNKICNLDSVTLATVQAYLGSGNKKNYRSLAHFIRQSIDKKTLFVTAPQPVVKSAFDVLYHLDENVWFSQVADYENYLKKIGLYIQDAPKIAIVGGLNDPFSGNRNNIDSLIVTLMRSGLNAYPVASGLKRLEFLKQINPDAVIYFPHGRLSMGSSATDWLKERNVPIFAPLSILQTQDKWENDKMGMFGGFLSQSVVMPEIDGGIYPYVLNLQEIDKDGVYLFKAVPERLAKFTKIIHNFIKLKNRANTDKKVAIFYFKGPGQSSLAAQGLNTSESLYNLLKRLKSEGYKIDNLPNDRRSFEKILMEQGAVFSTYAEGAFDHYLKNGNPLLIPKTQYETWCSLSMPASLYNEVTKQYGEAPGTYMSVAENGESYIAVARVQFGNVVLLPQPMAGLGGDEFAIVHGAKSPPPHTYIAPYLWAQHGFKADALIHFGTHGSLEFTPQKQVALSNYDWGDVLVGSLPHFYYYTIGNIGESVMAKRRSYATTVSYLTPAFDQSNTRLQYKAFTDAVSDYYKASDGAKNNAALRIKKIAITMGLHRELRLDSVLSKPYTPEEIEKLENFAEEIATEKTSGTFYVTGVSFSPKKIASTVMAMSADPVAYSIAALDKQRGKVSEQQLRSKIYFTQHYLQPAKNIVKNVLEGSKPDSIMISRIAGIAPHEIAKAKAILNPPRRSMSAMMQAKPRQQPSAEEKARARAIVEIERTVLNIAAYKTALEQSPEMELQALINGLAGGYISPSSGGDAVANPTAVPTGRNLYSVNAEATPSEVAWEKGVALAQATIEKYKKQHGNYPRKVSYTFWSSEFIESEGATIAQVLYMLGVEPVRDGFGRVSDLRLISSETLGRPRIDVVVQTSGQFRDIAASRLALISRAVEMATSATDGSIPNYVSQSTVETERQLVEQGVSPKNARELSTRRVFGGINGMYGTGIQEMITSSDRWENEKEIAEVYLNNMGAAYSDDKTWGEFNGGLLRAVLNNTDAIVQPRQSNTWGALSLDHVYEFMGGMNLTIRNVTGKDPDAYFADYRNRNNVRMQELKEAIGVETRSTVFNPEFVKEIVEGGASSAGRIEEIITNTFGWNVSKPDVIDNEVWDNFYKIYVKDEFRLNTRSFFERENPAALQEITAVMIETARKGMWKASEEQLKELAKVHTQMVEKYGSKGSGFSGSNKKLQQFIAQKVDVQTAKAYTQQIDKSELSANTENIKDGKVLKKEELLKQQNTDKNILNGLWIATVVIVGFVALLVFVRKRRKQE